jgi:MFS family permease
MDDETSNLLDNIDELTNESNSYHSKLMRNFLVMSLAFSFNHGCVVSCLAYTTAELGEELGSYGSGCLYFFYAFTAFLIAKPLVSMVGPKNGLLIGVAGYCVYIIGFLVAVIAPVVAWPVFIIAASIGGCAGGLLWTSQVCSVIFM